MPVGSSYQYTPLQCLLPGGGIQEETAVAYPQALPLISTGHQHLPDSLVRLKYDRPKIRGSYPSCFGNSLLRLRHQLLSIGPPHLIPCSGLQQPLPMLGIDVISIAYLTLQVQLMQSGL